jgi:acyl phosphate:glycerol-3-phosphate acyltransferase
VTVVVATVLGYLLGSIPTGLIVGRIAGAGDVRDYGSGKTGFTNSLRTLGVKWAILVVLVDVGKGSAAVLIGRFVFDEPMAAALAGVAAVLGHTFPVFAGFRGGRGVATAFGAFLAVSPLAAAVVLTFALVVLAIFRYASVMSIVGVFVGFLVIVALVLADRAAQPYLLFASLTMLAIEFNHVANIKRLLAGTEPKLGQGGQRRDPTGA